MVFDLSASFGVLGGTGANSSSSVAQSHLHHQQPPLIASSGLVLARAVGDFMNEIENCIPGSDDIGLSNFY